MSGNDWVEKPIKRRPVLDWQPPNFRKGENMNVQTKPLSGTGRRHGMGWTGREIKELLEMEAAGFTHAETAEALGRTEKSVRMKLYNMRNPLHKPGTAKRILTNPKVINLNESITSYVETLEADKAVKAAPAPKPTPRPKPLVKAAAKIVDDTYTVKLPKRTVKAVVVVTALAAAAAAGVVVGTLL